MSLNLQLSAAGDLVVTQGKTALVDSTTQRVATRLRMLLGEWFLDTSDGTPYLQDILVKGARLDLVRAAFDARVRGTEGVLDVVTVILSPDRVNRKIGATITAVGPDGAFTVVV